MWWFMTESKLVTVIILVGNKSDLVEHREVSEEEGKELADR